MQLSQINNTVVWLVGLALFLMVLDYFTGVLKALKQHDLQSSKMRDGLWHKLGFACALLLGEALDLASSHVSLPFAGAILPAVAVYIIVTEVTSILENLKEISPELSASKFLDIFQGTPTVEKKEDAESTTVSTEKESENAGN